MSTHPKTGRRLPYIGSHTRRFEGMSDAESEPLLAFLARHATQPEICFRLRWQPGTLACWDNRCTQHHAVDDYAGQRRVLHRVSIGGATPV